VRRLIRNGWLPFGEFNVEAIEPVSEMTSKLGSSGTTNGTVASLKVNQYFIRRYGQRNFNMMGERSAIDSGHNDNKNRMRT